MSFSFHSDVAEHPVFGTLSNAAFGLWVQAGTWTSANNCPGFVPDRAIEEFGDGEEMADEVGELVSTGAWTRIEGGWNMGYGPSSDFPLPVWRYDDEAPANGLIEIVHDPEL